MYLKKSTMFTEHDTDSLEKWVGELGNNVRVLTHHLDSKTTSRPPLHLLGSDFVFQKLKIRNLVK